MKKLQKWRIAQWLSEIRKGGGEKRVDITIKQQFSTFKIENT